MLEKNMNSYNQVASGKMMRLIAFALNEYGHHVENNTKKNSFIYYWIQNMNLSSLLTD